MQPLRGRILTMPLISTDINALTGNALRANITLGELRRRRYISVEVRFF